MILRRTAIRRLSCIATLAIAVASAPSARAQENPIAERLFLEGRTLMQEKKYEEACAKFKAAHELDRTATGTLLNLALCHEQINKRASAWAEFRQVAAESAGRREDRVTLAREHEAALFPKLSYVRILLPPEARVEGLEIVLDRNRPIAAASWGIELPIDPGKHVLVASAPGRQPAEVAITIGDAAESKTINVPKLGEAKKVVEIAEDTERDREQARATRRVLGFAIGGVGVAAVAVGFVFGASASSKNSDAKALCPNDVCPDDPTRLAAARGIDSAKGTANVSNVLVGAGAALAIGGLVLVLISLPNASSAPPPPPLSNTTAKLGIVPVPSGAGLSWGGTL